MNARLSQDARLWEVAAEPTPDSLADCLEKHENFLREVVDPRVKAASEVERSKSWIFYNSLQSSWRAVATELPLAKRVSERSGKCFEMAVIGQPSYDYTSAVGGNDGTGAEGRKKKVSVKSGVVSTGGVLLEGPTARNGVGLQHYALHSPWDKAQISDLLFDVERLLSLGREDLAEHLDGDALHVAEQLWDYYKADDANGTGTRGGLLKIRLAGSSSLSPVSPVQDRAEFYEKMKSAWFVLSDKLQDVFLSAGEGLLTDTDLADVRRRVLQDHVKDDGARARILKREADYGDGLEAFSKGRAMSYRQLRAFLDA